MLGALASVCVCVCLHRVVQTEPGCHPLVVALAQRGFIFALNVLLYFPSGDLVE